MLPCCEPSARWVWQSMRPGKTVECERSIVFTLAAIVMSGPTCAIVPCPRMRMVWLVRRGEWVTSMSLPVRMARVMGGGWVGDGCCCALVANAESKKAKGRRDLIMVRGFYLDGEQLGS